MTATLALDGLRVIDADTHLTESHDLWTKRAPAKYQDRVPHVVDVEGKPMWYVDGVELGFAGGGGVIDNKATRAPPTRRSSSGPRTASTSGPSTSRRASP